MSYKLTIDEIGALDPETVIVPVGSVEQHGHHLPVSTDVLIAQAVADRIGEKLNAYVLPCIPVSTCREHMGKRGSVWMNPDTFYMMMKDIVYSLKEQEYKKIIILQGHGGIFVMNPLIRTLNASLNPDVMICKFEPYQLFSQFLGNNGENHDEISSILDSSVIMHADEFETSIIMYLHPEMVHADKIVDWVPDVPSEYLNYGSIFRICPDGVWGEPSKATAEKGRKLLEAGTKLGMEYIENTFKFMSEKGKYGYSDF
jgi:creatinine amidohydrolase